MSGTYGRFGGRDSCPTRERGVPRSFSRTNLLGSLLLDIGIVAR